MPPKEDLRITKDIMDFSEEYDYILGIDEVGWGAIAGPITVGACLLSSDYVHDGIKDSKRFTSSTKREAVFEDLMEDEVEWDLVHIDTSQIDEDTNVGPLKDKAMRYLVNILLPDDHAYGKVLVVVDGKRNIPNLQHKQVAIVGADDKVKAVGAASIIAKVVRDRRMEHLGIMLGGDPYKWTKNKGYQTKEHKALLKEHGVSDFHRNNVSTVREMNMAKKKKVENIKHGETILAALEEMPMFVSDLVSLTGVDATSTRTAVQQLSKHKHISKDSKGRWSVD